MKTAEEILKDKFKNHFLDFEYFDLHIEAMDEYANQSKWIKVSEQPPEKDTPIWIYLNDGNQYVGRYTKLFDKMEFVSLAICMTEKVTHWQPLPESPKQD